MTLNSLAFTVLVCVVCAVAQAHDFGRSHFADWPEAAAPQVVGERVTEHLLASPHMRWEEFGTLHYAEVALSYGALTFAQLAHRPDLTKRIAHRFETLLQSRPELVPPVTHVDHSVFGALPLELYVQTGHARHRLLGLAFAEGQWDNPAAEGWTNQARFWIDDMYMITLLQAQAWRATGRVEYLDRTAALMEAYLARLQQSNGLFFHAPDAPFYWGRGNGWMAAGTTELLRALPAEHPRRGRILAAYRQMMATLLRHQTSSGLWRQLIDHPDAWLESSASAMFTFAFISGVKHGWLDADSYGPAARKAWLGLVSYLDANGALREVCVGTPAKNDLQHYLDRPRASGDFHGQAPLLWAASALLR